MQKGSLYIIPTPIGNLKDITYRAVELLGNVDYVLSEDTRETTKLFNHFSITKPQISYRDQNHQKVIGQILNLLEQGLQLALVSDGGTPLISDPGFKLVEKIIAEGHNVISLPGPSSVTSALVMSGLPTDKFSFLGFLPKVKSGREKLLVEYGKTESTLIIFESPFRLIKLLEELLRVLGDRQICVVGELTKMYEKVFRGKVSDVTAALGSSRPRGEFVVLVAKEDF